MNRVLVSIPVSENAERALRAEQILCRIMLQAPAGTFLKRSKRTLSLVIPDPQRLRPVSLWDDQPRSNPRKFHFDFDDVDVGHSFLLGATGKGMSR
ncbi:hypothetical protein [Acidithiobacillus albertensis]|uniref:hypothetical protein n=1 Tax=Acidithiobacillus albertensis TaxID=119978 RepID=UPI00094B36E8|nr:hypothetical protein [Acidithiobacillus albertensis]